MTDWDLRPLERLTSLMVWPAFALLAFLPAMVVLPFAAVAPDQWQLVVGGGLCLFLAGIPTLFALIAFLRWTRTGRARAFLNELADDVNGDVELGSFVFPLLSPRLSGESKGRKFRVDLRRAAGFLSPSRVGKKFLLWGWYGRASVAIRTRGPKLGLAPKGTAMASLFGLIGPVSRGEIEVYTGGKEAGNRLADAPDVEALAKRVFAVLGPCFVRLDEAGARAAVILPRELTPDELGDVLVALRELAERYDAACSA